MSKEEVEEEISTDRLFEIYEEHLKKVVEVTAEGVNLHIDHAWEVTPELVMNLMMRNTLERGEDISQCAELYTVGIDRAGLAVVADSFGALQTRVARVIPVCALTGEAAGKAAAYCAKEQCAVSSYIWQKVK